MKGCFTHTTILVFIIYDLEPIFCVHWLFAVCRLACIICHRRVPFYSFILLDSLSSPEFLEGIPQNCEHTTRPLYEACLPNMEYLDMASRVLRSWCQA
jgi:hypothetical protein